MGYAVFVTLMMGLLALAFLFDPTDTSDTDETVDGGETVDDTDKSELLTGGDGNDTLHGAGGDDRLEGSAGSDTISGGQGNDTIFGGAVDDALSGGTGNDFLQADSGTDTLDDGEGDDVLRFGSNDTATGGSGADLFQVDAADILANGIATITDFDADSGDVINLMADQSIINANHPLESVSPTTLPAKPGMQLFLSTGWRLPLRPARATACLAPTCG